MINPGAERENAAIVAWLRRMAETKAREASGFEHSKNIRLVADLLAGEYRALADAIERGDHLR